MMLSICVPTYNRENELECFFKYLKDQQLESVEIIVCDDGSTDGTKSVIEKYSGSMNIKYLYQTNQGRSIALKKAILNASGKYSILMDSDDYFLPNAIDEIFKGIGQLESGNLSSNIKALLFGVKLIKGGNDSINLPLEGITNFIAARADLKIKNDLKEVVLTNALKSVMYDVPIGCRRVPTSLLWARIAQDTQCLSIPKAIAVKEYLPGGMSDKILTLKTKYSQPMTELYELLAESNVYSSLRYRIRSRILWSRHAWHTGNVKPKVFWQFMVWPLGGVIYALDKRKLTSLK